MVRSGGVRLHGAQCTTVLLAVLGAVAVLSALSAAEEQKLVAQLKSIADLHSVSPEAWQESPEGKPSDSTARSSFGKSTDGTLLFKSVKRREARVFKKKEFREDLESRLTATDLSLLSPLYQLKGLHFDGFSIPKTYVLVQRNLNQPAIIGEKNEVSVQFDLKMCSSDRVTMLGTEKVTQGKELMGKIRPDKAAPLMRMSAADKGMLKTAIKADIGFLRAQEVIDYSLLVTVRLEKGAPEDTIKPHGVVRVPVSLLFRLDAVSEAAGGQKHIAGDAGAPPVERKGYVAYFSVIDFLTKFGRRKMLEAKMKDAFQKGSNHSTIAPGPYADRFMEGFDRMFVAAGAGSNGKDPSQGADTEAQNQAQNKDDAGPVAVIQHDTEEEGGGSWFGKIMLIVLFVIVVLGAIAVKYIFLSGPSEEGDDADTVNPGSDAHWPAEAPFIEMKTTRTGSPDELREVQLPTEAEIGENPMFPPPGSAEARDSTGTRDP